MGGYIGAKTGTLVASASDIRGDISATDTTPEITLKNTTETDADGTRSGKITFKGEQSGGEESILAQIQGSHDGTADDEKGDLIFKTNDGNDATSPTERVRINSAGDVLVSSPDPSLTITNTTEEDTDGGRESTIVFKGEQSGGELSTLAEIEASHDGTADDEKGDLIFRTNDGSDGASPTERVRIDSNGSILTATLGTDNVHLGEGAGASIASGGNQNVAIGKDAGTSLTTGDSNTFIGAKVGDAITTASANVAIGGDATYAALGSDTQGKFTTAIGVGALRAQNFTSDTQTNNVAVGYFAGGVMTTGTANTFVGSLAGDDCIDGIQNVAVGASALSADAGNNNTAVGESALTSTTGANNTAIGAGAGNAITTGSKNSILGMYNGNQGGLDIRTASNQIVLSDGDGNPRLRIDDNGQNSVTANAFSYWCFKVENQNNSSGNGTYRSLIGSNADNASSYHFVANAGADRLYIYGNGNVVNSNNSYGALSDQKLKENIVDSGSQWDDIKAVRVRKFSMKEEELDAPNKIGVIAQELEASGMGGLVFESPDRDEDGNVLETSTKQVHYSVLYMKAIKALQEAMTRIETLETQNTTQATQIADLITRVEALEGA